MSTTFLHNPTANNVTPNNVTPNNVTPNNGSLSRPIRVDLGEQRLSQSGERLSLVLGSCVGLCLWDEGTQTGAVAHIMLPFSQGLSASPERFADQAVDLLLNRFRDLQIPLTGLIAKLVGGACLAESTTGGGIGEEIVAVVKATLESENIAIAGDQTGGDGCRAVFDCSTGSLSIDSIDGQKQIA